jgi:hypothetical protein
MNLISANPSAPVLTPGSWVPLSDLITVDYSQIPSNDGLFWFESNSIPNGFPYNLRFGDTEVPAGQPFDVTLQAPDHGNLSQFPYNSIYQPGDDLSNVYVQIPNATALTLNLTSLVDWGSGYSPTGNVVSFSIPSSAPSLLDYFEFSELAYDLTPSGFVFSTPALFSAVPPGWVTWSEADVALNYESTGLTAVVFIDNTLGDSTYHDVVISFRGSVTAHDWLVTDRQLANGTTPPEFAAALDYAQFIETSLGRGFSYFVTGHSLGGAEAEVVAAAMRLGGDTFAAPGVGHLLATTNGNINNGINLTNYVIAGDAIGN